MAKVNMKGNPPDATILGSPEPAYPYGLCLSLGEEEIKKLNLVALPAVGQVMNLNATVSVQRIETADSAEGGKRRSMSLQITDMELMGEGEDDSSGNRSHAKLLYDFDEVG